MDGVHDLGGRQGFGAVKVSDDDPAFETEADARIYALSQSVGPSEGTIDWFRHTIELMPPAAYMTERYFQKWLYVIMVEQIQDGGLTVDEILGSAPAGAPISDTPPPAMSVQDAVDKVRAQYHSFALDTDAAPAFATGQQVRTLRHGHDGHIRLPGYARGAAGEIIAHHGAHVLPDTGARGQEVPDHLYTVAFAAQELWGADADPRDTVTLDLWERYLVSA